LNEGDKILDIGVGLGRILSRIETKVEKFGVDISMRYLKEAHNKGINVCLSKIEELPYQDNFFDMVVSTDVLEHVFDLHTCISQIMRVLKPGGIVIVRVPFREDLTAYLSYDKYKFVHVRSFDEASLLLSFTRLSNALHMETNYAGLIKSPQKYIYPFLDTNEKLNFIQNILTLFRLSKYRKETLRMFCAQALLEYKKYDFSFKNYFIINQIFKIVYLVFNMIQGKKFYQDDDIYQKIEISVVFKKRN
jgi:ubiquinone/menaquinone biosynthesis C-methylase UbiE